MTSVGGFRPKPLTGNTRTNAGAFQKPFRSSTLRSSTLSLVRGGGGGGAFRQGGLLPSRHRGATLALVSVVLIVRSSSVEKVRSNRSNPRFEIATFTRSWRGSFVEKGMKPSCFPLGTSTTLAPEGSESNRTSTKGEGGGGGSGWRVTGRRAGRSVGGFRAGARAALGGGGSTGLSEESDTGSIGGGATGAEGGEFVGT